MKVNVLMSTFNGERYLEKQIESIFNQSSSCDIQLWVRDDGSTDGTRNILNVWQDQGRLIWYSGDNLGPAHSFIDLLFSCDEADYYAFADQDDIWKSNKIQRAIDKIHAEKTPVLYYSNAELHIGEKPSGQLVYKRNEQFYDLPSISCNGGALGCTMVFSKELRDVIVSHSRPKRVFMHDFYLLELCSAIDGKIIYDSYPSMYYRQHNDNVIGVKKDIVSKIQNRLADISKHYNTGIAEQADDLLENYSDIIRPENKKWLMIISDYRKSLKSRLFLGLNANIKNTSTSMGLKIRISILLGNR